jgi:nickel/cobalt exporter
VPLAWAAVSVAILHTILPVHWLPYVTVAKANGWSLLRALGVTAVGMLIHLASTFVITLLALLLSHGLTHTTSHVMERAGAVVLIALALLYLLFPARLQRWYARVGWFLAVGVGIQPCVELVPLMVVAAAVGTSSALLVGGAWTITTFALSLLLVAGGMWGIGTGWAAWAGKYGYVITGVVLLISGASALVHTH